MLSAGNYCFFQPHGYIYIFSYFLINNHLINKFVTEDKMHRVIHCPFSCKYSAFVFAFLYCIKLLIV